MFFLIITCRSLFWILSSIGTFMLLLSAITTPKWLVAKSFTDTNSRNRTKVIQQSIGLYNKCIYSNFKGILEFRCYVYARSVGKISSVAWQACIVFLGIAITFLAIAALFGVISICKQLIRRKSLMNLAGIMQAFAGISLIVAIILFPVGWDNKQVERYCYESGDKAEKFKTGHCSIGVSYFLAMGATAASFFCSLFSFVADKAVFSPKVQDEILEGKQLICLP